MAETPGGGGSFVEMGKPGCGFEKAAFCDTFDRPSTARGRGGDLDPAWWSAARMQGELSATRAMGIGMAVIPQCRPGLPTHVWPNDDTLVCNPTSSIQSNHLLVAVAAQNYGQNGYRIRQPFDFTGRTGKIVFDASVNVLGPLHGWVSLAITEDPIALPGYALLGNDEGSIIPKNAVEVHFVNFNDGTRIIGRNVQVFRNYVDTVYEPPSTDTAPAFVPGKLNHYEFLVSEEGIEVSLTPPSEDGVTFPAAQWKHTLKTKLPFTRGYVHVSAHNHAMLKYTQPDRMPVVVDATVAQLDNIGFDGPVLPSAREYEIPNALVKFADTQSHQDPYNPEGVGYDIGYVVGDAGQGPKQVLRFEGVDTANVASAKLTFSAWVNSLSPENKQASYSFRARLNGKKWLERKLLPEEAAFFTNGPTVIAPDGSPVGDPHTQGRLGLMLDVPVEDLVPGTNSVEFITENVPTNYPPIICNIDLILRTK